MRKKKKCCRIFKIRDRKSRMYMKTEIQWILNRLRTLKSLRKNGMKTQRRMTYNYWRKVNNVTSWWKKGCQEFQRSLLIKCSMTLDEIQNYYILEKQSNTLQRLWLANKHYAFITANIHLRNVSISLFFILICE